MIVKNEQIAVVAAPIPAISTEQRNILIEISQGAHDKQIAQKCGMSMEWVKNEEQKLRHLLYARNRCHLVAIAIRHGLIDHPNPYPEPGVRTPPYAFLVLLRDTLDQTPDLACTIAVVAVKDSPMQLWSIRLGGTLAWSGTTWDSVPAMFSPEWIATHTWPFNQVFDIAKTVVRTRAESARRRTL